jgi:hypothetical protein
MESYMYVFTGNKSIFPVGIFNEFELASQNIEKYKLSGILTKYPININLYEWALDNNFLEIKNESQKNPKFIEQFSCASTEHYHFEEGYLID